VWKTNILLDELEVRVVVQVDGVGIAAIEDILGCGTTEHDGRVVAMVRLLL
jgi:hypothetical protein